MDAQVTCENCENALVIKDIVFYTDHALIESFARNLLSGNQEDMRELMIDVYQRMSGVCMCAAYSKNECICGAWD